MQNNWHYVSDSSNFIEQIKSIGKVQQDAINAADVIIFYPGVLQKEGLEEPRKMLDKEPTSQCPSNNLIKLAKFFLKQKFFLISWY